MRRAEITARRSRRLWARSVVVYLGLHEFFGESVEQLQLLSSASADSDSVWRLTQPPLQLFALSDHLFERIDEAFHLAFLPDGEAHVIWKSWEQPPDVNLALFHCLDQRDNRAFAIEHDEVRLGRNLFIAHLVEFGGHESFGFTIQTLTV